MSIFVVRKHNNDKYTSAMYYWTSYGKGFNNTEHFFRLEKEEQEELENLFVEKENAEETDYAIVHNFIYQAIRGEKEYDDEVVDACKSFKIDQYILAPENEFECKPLDIDFIAVAKKSENWWVDKWYTPNERRKLPDDNVPYSYEKPQYPATLNYHYPDVIEELYDVKYDKGMPKEFIDKVLALPHDELREDLENLLYLAMSLGDDVDEWPEEYGADEFYVQVCSAMQFLGAIGDARSLPVILEFLKQRDSFCHFFFGDFSSKILSAPIAYCFKEQYQVVEDFLKTKGSDPSWKTEVVEIMNRYLPLVLEDTTKLKKFFVDMLRYYLEIGESWDYYDRDLAAFICETCCDLHATEALPYIKQLLDRGLAEKSVAGDYKDMCETMESTKERTEELRDIYAYRGVDG